MPDKNEKTCPTVGEFNPYSRLHEVLPASSCAWDELNEKGERWIFLYVARRFRGLL